MLATMFDVSTDFLFALALAGLIISVILLVQSRLLDLHAWAVGIVSLALVMYWWPS